MNRALAVRHSHFGRVAVLDFERPLTSHAHPHGHLLIALAGPDTHFCVEGIVYPLTLRQAIFVPPWREHSYPHHSFPNPTTILAVYLHPDWLGAQGEPQGPVRRTLTASAAALARELVEALVLQTWSDADFEAGVGALLAALRVGAAPGARETMDNRILKARALIETSLSENLQFSALAREAGLSRPHFFELFHRTMGCTPNVYRNALRMETALARLAEHEPSLTALSLDLGFSAHSNFTRFFRDIQGVGPGEYRSALASAPSGASPGQEADQTS